ncbi:heme NO-binding domain-containing protein [Undibacterium arcticum]
MSPTTWPIPSTSSIFVVRHRRPPSWWLKLQVRPFAGTIWIMKQLGLKINAGLHVKKCGAILLASGSLSVDHSAFYFLAAKFVFRIAAAAAPIQHDIFASILRIRCDLRSIRNSDVRHGFFTEFMEMVEDRFSPAIADSVIESAKLPHGGAYTAVGYYAHEEIIALVVGLSKQTGIPVPDLVTAFGQHLLKRFSEIYPQMFASHTSLFSFCCQHRCGDPPRGAQAVSAGATAALHRPGNRRARDALGV